MVCGRVWVSKPIRVRGQGLGKNRKRRPGGVRERSATRAGLGMTSCTRPQYSQGGRGSPRRASGPDTQTKVEKASLDARGRRRGRGQNRVWSSARRLQTPLSPRACFSFRSRLNRASTPRSPFPPIQGVPSLSSLWSLFTSCPPAAMLPLRLCRPVALNPPCGSSRPPGSERWVGPRDPGPVVH